MQIKKLFIALGIVFALHMQGKLPHKDAPGSNQDLTSINSIVKIMNCINKISLTVVHLIF